MGVGVGVVVGVGVGVVVAVTEGVGVGLVLGLLSDDNPPNTIIPPSIVKLLKLTLPVISKPDGLRSKMFDPTVALNLLLVILSMSTSDPEFSTETTNSPEVDPTVEFSILDFNCT